jgi:hypothetical protein
VLTVVTPRAGDPRDLENAILHVRRTATDGEAADRVTGEILALDPPPRSLRAALPVVEGPSTITHGGVHAR